MPRTTWKPTGRGRIEQRRGCEVFGRAAPTFDQVGPRFFAHYGRRLAELVELPTGAAVLDVAAGRGASLLPAAKRVGPRGRAVGADLSAGMVRELAAEAERSSVRHIEVCRMQAERLAFAAASFDAVLCGHAIYYFAGAVHEFHRVLKPDGQIGLSIVARGSHNWMWEAFRSHAPSGHAPPDEEGEEQDGPALDTPGGLQRLLEQGRFEDLRIVDEQADFVYADEGDWWATMWTMGCRGMMEAMKPGTLVRFRADIVQRLQAFKRPDGFHVPFRVLLARGTKPEVKDEH
jgi:O-methyltransferase/aklanonic acid methyltransferase